MVARTYSASAVSDSRAAPGLRVADASVMPSIPASNTNAAAILAGERAAEFILEDHRSES